MVQEWLKGPDLEVEGWEVSVEGEWRGWRERQKHSRQVKWLHEGSESGFWEACLGQNEDKGQSFQLETLGEGGCNQVLELGLQLISA